MVGKIYGTGSYIPETVVDNNDLAKIVETNDEWIRERTGVIRRHIAERETTVTLAVKAAERAVENAGIAADEIDLILVASLSPSQLCPTVSCEVQKAIGAVNATCFDLNAACTGFLFAFHTAQSYIQAGMFRTVLIIGAECLSNLVDWTDRGTCILFGDGYGAAVVKAAEEGSFYSKTHSDGAKGEALLCESRNQRKFEGAARASETYIHMDGQAVFKFAVKRVPEVIQEVLENAGDSAEDIKYFVLHQANKRIVESVAKRLKADIGKFPMNLQEYGNTSSASIPILLDEMNRKGMLERGDKIILSGFGAGLSWGAALIEW